ncbi:MAG TPA: M48 family peptidase [Chromatiales bacterium]|nr:M48 family peptidase [Chromatiales bacterium]
MDDFRLLFLLFLAVATLTQLWLNRRHIRHVLRHRDRVPDAFRERITLQSHRRAADYTVARTHLGGLETLYGGALLLGWTVGGGLEWLDRAWRGMGLGPLVTGVAVLLTVFLLLGLLELPFSVYHTFVLEERFGFNRSTPAVFAGDLVRQFALTVVLGTPLVWVALWLMAHAGGLWWLYVWAVWIGFGLLMTWAYPTLIAPLFNRFSPLDDTALRVRIERLLARCGFSSSGVFVMDGSRRSAHGNAYFTGLGRHKRIVFFDTLLGNLEHREVEAVLAHELGHFRLHHVRKRLVHTALLSLAGLAVLAWLMRRPWFYSGLGVTTPSDYTALLLFLLVLPTFTFLLQPIAARLSRRHEYEADAFAAEQAEPNALIRALVTLYEENASTLTPDPLYSAFHDSHPPAPLRIAHLSDRMATKPAGA